MEFITGKEDGRWILPMKVEGSFERLWPSTGKDARALPPRGIDAWRALGLICEVYHRANFSFYLDRFNSSLTGIASVHPPGGETSHQRLPIIGEAQKTSRKVKCLALPERARCRGLFCCCSRPAVLAISRVGVCP